MNITIQAPDFISAHRPVEYVVESGNTTQAIEKLLVKVYVNGSLVATFRKDWYNKIDAGSGQFNYFFKCDTQAILRTFLAPQSSESPDALISDTGTQVTCDDSVLKTYCTFQIEFRNTNNLLESLPTVLTSNTINVFNIIRQHDELISLQPYLVNSNRALLTDMPDGTNISDGDAYTFAAIYKAQSFGETILVELQKVTGLPTYHTADITVPTPDDEKVIAIACGPRQWPNWSWSTQPVLDDTVSGYRVGFGFIDETGGHFAGKTVSFSVVKKCHSDFRLHWLNSRGGVDSYTFSGRKLKAVESRNTQAQRALSFNTSTYSHDAQQKGVFTLQPDRTDYWEIESRIEMEDVADWLSGIASSPDVYVELPGLTHFTPVYLTDAQFVTSDTEQVGIILKAKVFLSNKFLTHSH